MLAPIVLAVALWVTYGSGFVGYDGMYSLPWGSDIAHGRSPALETALAPTPHPLAIAAGALLAPFGNAAPALFQVTILV